MKGHVDRVFEWHEKQGRDRSGNAVVYVSKIADDGTAKKKTLR